MARQMGAGELIGHRVLDNDGNNVGKIGQVFYDDESSMAKWVTVRTGMFGGHETFVPLQGSQAVEDDIQVPFGKQTIKDAPHFDVDQSISAEEEHQIYQHYDVAYPGVPGQRASSEEMRPGEAGYGRHEAGSMGADTGMDTGMSATAEPGAEEMGADATALDTAMDTGPSEASMTRSEEQVHIDVEREEAGRPHLRKHVETEEFQSTVPVTREELRVDREPADGSERGDMRMEDDDQEFILHEERPTVSKESVPVERVRVRKEEVTEDQTVRGERRRERVELEDEDDDSPPPAS